MGEVAVARLYFIHAPGCPACEETAPGVAAFQRAHPEVPVAHVDLTATEWKARWQPRFTPTFVLVGHGPTRILEGGVNGQELERWVQAKLSS